MKTLAFWLPSCLLAVLAAARRPNIVFIFTDDQVGWTLADAKPHAVDSREKLLKASFRDYARSSTNTS